MLFQCVDLVAEGVELGLNTIGVGGRGLDDLLPLCSTPGDRLRQLAADEAAIRLFFGIVQSGQGPFFYRMSSPDEL